MKIERSNIYFTSNKKDGDEDGERCLIQKILAFLDKASNCGGNLVSNKPIITGCCYNAHSNYATMSIFPPSVKS